VLATPAKYPSARKARSVARDVNMTALDAVVANDD
jgi:hypothetical protein